MLACGFNIRRAWSGTCPDGKLRDYFATSVAHRIHEYHQSQPVVVGVAELVEDFVYRCDAVFAEYGPDNHAAAAKLAAEIDINDFWDHCIDDDE